MISIVIVLFGAMMIFAVTTFIFEGRNVKENRYSPLCTFIVPCYNCEKTIEETLKSIYNSYNKIQLIAINDGSKDNTLLKLMELKEKYNFKIINNEENLGKTASINNASKFANGEIIFFIDADIVVNKKSVEDILNRFGNNNNLGAASARLTVKSRSIYSIIMSMQYNMLSIAQSPYNLTSTISLWGGCMAINKKAFNEVGGFSYHAIGEDMDLALRLFERGWKIHQSVYPSYTYPPKSFKDWYKQQVRWGASGVQCVLTHFKTYLKNPMAVIFMVFNIVYFLIILDYLFLPDLEAVTITNRLLTISFYLLISFPYLAIDFRSIKDIKYSPIIIIYMLIYAPIYSIVSAIGFTKGLYLYPKLKRSKARGW